MVNIFKDFALTIFQISVFVPPDFSNLTFVYALSESLFLSELCCTHVIELWFSRIETWLRSSSLAINKYNIFEENTSQKDVSFIW